MSRVVAGTRPYPWPFDGRLDARRVAIIVAGADHHWVARCTEVQSVTANLEALVALRAAGVLGVAVRHAEGLTGALDGKVDLEVAAGGVDGFFDSPLDGLLRHHGRDQLLMCGFGLEGPVHSTLRSANDRGYECLTLIDASASLDPATGDAAISTITMSGGIFGAVGDTASVVQALITDAIVAPIERKTL